MENKWNNITKYHVRSGKHDYDQKDDKELKIPQRKIIRTIIGPVRMPNIEGEWTTKYYRSWEE